MPNPTHVHWIRNYDLITGFGDTSCGYRGIYRKKTKFLLFDAFRNKSADKFEATTAFCEVTCAKCARYRLSRSRIAPTRDATVSLAQRAQK